MAILRQSIVQPAVAVVTEVEKLLDEAEQVAKRLENSLGQAQQFNDECATDLASRVFPIGKMLEVALEEVRRGQWWISRQMSGLTKLFGKAYRGVRQIGARLRGHKDVKPHEELDGQQIGRLSELLFTKLRSTFPQEATDGLLTERRCRPLLEEFKTMPSPSPADTWIEEVQSEVRQWVKDHPTKARLLPLVVDCLAIGGLSALAVDCFVGGGLGTLTASVLASAGTATAGGLLGRFLVRLGMQRVFDKSMVVWQQQRRDEVAAHFRNHLTDPLCSSHWRGQLRDLAEASVEECRDACRRIREHAHGEETTHARS